MITQYCPHTIWSISTNPIEYVVNILLLYQASPCAYCQKDNSPISKLIESERFIALSRWFVYITSQLCVDPLLTTALVSVTDWESV